MPFAFDAEIFHYKEDASMAIRFFLLLGCQSIQCFRSENRLFSGQILGRSTSPHKSTECQYFWPTVSRCVIPPENISSIRIVKTELQSNRTISYHCEEGYELPEGVQPVIITCSSPDEDNIPWTWNDTHINELLRCQRGMLTLCFTPKTLRARAVACGA